MNLHAQESTGQLAPVRKIGDVWIDGGKAWERVRGNLRQNVPIIYTEGYHGPVGFGLRDLGGALDLHMVSGIADVSEAQELRNDLCDNAQSEIGHLMQRDEIEVWALVETRRDMGLR